MSITQISVPTSITVSVRKRSIEITDVQSWPLDSIAKVFTYGFQQIFNDAAASAKTDAEADALVAKRRANLAAGILRASPIRESDPVKAEAVAMAIAKVEAAIKRSGKKVADYAAADIRSNALALIEKDPAIMEAAKVAVDAKASAMGEVEIDLSSLVAKADKSTDE